MTEALPPVPTRSTVPIPRAPLVGRGRELAELEDALARVCSEGRTETVTLIGGAGVGKSRLLGELSARAGLRQPGLRVFRGIVQPGGQSHGVMQRILRARFGLADHADLDVARETLRSTVSELMEDQRVTELLHFLGAYLDVDFPESPFTKAFEFDGEQFARISRAVLRRFLEVDARRAPLLLTFEDLHGADDETLDLVKHLTVSAVDAPILFVVSSRPELLVRRPEWLDGPRHHHLPLAPLKPDDSAKLVLSLLEPTGDPPDELVEAAVDVAGGSPYLLEQMVRAFLDGGALLPQPDGRWDVDLTRLDDVQLPLSVDDAIAARIASMTPAERELLERASTMGGVFWLGALVALGRLDASPPERWGGAEDLATHQRDILTRLIDRDYLLRFDDASIPGEEEYAFKHNLEREALHRLINPSAGRRFHRRVAEWLELRLPEQTEEHCELLGQHYERGGSSPRAAHFYIAAGDRARERYANARASDHYARGLELLGEGDLVRRIDALHHQGDVLQLLGRNEEALGAFRAMLELAWRLDVKAKGGAAHNRIGRVYRAIGQLEEAMRHLGTGHALFDAAGDRRGVASSLDDVGKVHWMRGAYEAAERFIRQGLELRRELGDRRSIALSLNNLGLVHQDSGRFDEALTDFQEALAIRREIGDLPGMAQTLNNLGTIHQDQGDHERSSALWSDALEYARRVGDRMREAVILTNLGESNYRMGRPEVAIQVLSEAERISEHLGDRILEGEILRGLAKAHMLRSDLPAARGYVARSIERFEQAGSKPFLGMALRTMGEIEAAGGWGGEDHAKAEDAFGKAMSIFEALGNEIELARTCESFGRFLEASADPSDEARRMRARGLRERALTVHGRQLASGV